MTNENKLPLIYTAGGIMSKGEQMQRAAEAAELRELGYPLYVPQENEKINDKANAKQEGLAERIVRHDTDAILAADIIVIEPQAHALGTITELGMIQGMKIVAKLITEIMDNEQLTDSEVVEEIDELVANIIGKKVYPHFSDIRRTDIPEVGDRRSWGVNQFVYGVCLDLSEGKGFYSWEEIIEQLKNDK